MQKSVQDAMIAWCSEQATFLLGMIDRYEKRELMQGEKVLGGTTEEEVGKMKHQLAEVRKLLAQAKY